MLYEIFGCMCSKTGFRVETKRGKPCYGICNHTKFIDRGNIIL